MRSVTSAVVSDALRRTMKSTSQTNHPPVATFSVADVERVLEAVRPTLARHGGGIELVCVDGCDVRVALRGACVGCPSSLMTLRESVERQFREELAGFGTLIAEEPTASTGVLSSVWKRIVARDPALR